MGGATGGRSPRDGATERGWALGVEDQPEGEMRPFGEREEELPQALVEAVGAENVQIPARLG